MKRLFFFWAVLLLLCGASLYAADHFSDAVLYLLIVLAALWVTIGTWTDVFSSTHTKPFRRRFLSGLFHFATIMCFTLVLYLQKLILTTDLNGDIVLLPILFALIFTGADFYFDQIKQYPKDPPDNDESEKHSTYRKD